MLLLPGSGYVMSGCTGREKKRARVSLPGHVPTNEPDKLVLAVPAHLGTYPRYLDRIHCMVAPPRIPVDATHNSWATSLQGFHQSSLPGHDLLHNPKPIPVLTAAFSDFHSKKPFRRLLLALTFTNIS